ncbi:hypothetical protein Tco_1072649 [Tanacetum coccineum]
MLTNKGWVDGNGSNPGGGFGKPGSGQEMRGGGDGLEGPGGQLSMVVYEKSGEVVKKMEFEDDDYKEKVVI